MFVKIDYVKTEFQRLSSNGKLHKYYRNRAVITLRCDSCGELFERNKGDMDPKRLTNEVYHVCKSCDAKVFAQQKGVENRTLWDMPASSLKSIGVISRSVNTEGDKHD